jgi:hypothetical protein
MGSPIIRISDEYYLSRTWLLIHFSFELVGSVMVYSSPLPQTDTKQGKRLIFKKYLCIIEILHSKQCQNFLNN